MKRNSKGTFSLAKRILNYIFFFNISFRVIFIQSMDRKYKNKYIIQNEHIE